MNLEKLKQIEKNSDIKLKYLSSGTWGSNKIMYIPAILIAVSVIWFVMYACFLAKMMPKETTIIHLGSSLGVALICIFWFRIISKKIKQRNCERINEFPVCLGKISMGNDQERVYYCIYTTGQKRLDMDWLNHINYKIWHTVEEPDSKLRDKINLIFVPKVLAATSADSTLLPVKFTEGEEVFMKIFRFQPEKDILVKQNDGFFPIIFFNKISVPVIKEEDYMD